MPRHLTTPNLGPAQQIKPWTDALCDDALLTLAEELGECTLVREVALTLGLLERDARFQLVRTNPWAHEQTAGVPVHAGVS